MSEQSDSTGTELAESQPWYQIWIDAITKPSPKTFERIVADPNISAGKAYGWIFIVSVFSSIVSFGVSGLFGDGLGSDVSDLIEPTIFTLVCGVVVAPVIALLLWMLNVAITQAIAGALGGSGTYTKLLYAVASYWAPLVIITTGLSIVPFVSLLNIPVAIYGFVLNVIAIKGVNQFSWGKAILSSFGLMILLVFVAICMIVFLALLGPAIGNVFSNIILDI